MLKWSTPKAPQLRYCAKVALAAVAAYALTLGERSDYALFSVLSATLVMGTSVGEDLNTSLNRVRGTIAGVVVGTVIAHVFGMSIWSLGIAVATLVWISTGFNLGTAALRVGIALILVVMLMHTADYSQYGGWRLLNTVIGVAIGVAVSRFVWPVRGRDEIAGAMDRALASIAAVLDAVALGATPDALQPLQVQLLDALAALRTARKNAIVEQRITRATDMLTPRSAHVMRAGIATLGASIKCDELAHAGVHAACLEAVYQTVASLAAHARDVTKSEQPPGDFAARHEAALREAAHPDLDPGTRALQAGLLDELQHIHAALQALGNARSQEIARPPV